MNKRLGKIITIITVLLIATVATVVLLQKRTVAGNREYKVVTVDYTTETTEVQTEEETEATTEAETTVVEITETQTEEVATVVEETEATTEVVTTEAQTEVATEVATTAAPVVEEKKEVKVEAEVKEVVTPVATSDMTDVSYNGTKYATLTEAKANINVATLTSDEAKAVAANNKTTYAAYVTELVDSINAYRTANGLNAVVVNDNLTNAAMHRAAESAYADWNMTAKENGAKRHIRPNFEKASSIGKEYGISGAFAENYGRYQSSPAEILAGWQNSSAHNAVLTSANYSSVGIGVAADSEGYLYWIAIFN